MAASREDYVQVENELAIAMLEEAARNSNIKEVLRDIANVFIQHVLQPIRLQLSLADDFSALPPAYQHVIKDFVEEHTAEKRQYGAIFPEIQSVSDILNSAEKLDAFLKNVEVFIANVKTYSTPDEIAKVIKAIIELGFSYYEGFAHTPAFPLINQYLTLSSEEVDIRVYRTEMGQPAQDTVTFGIRKNAEDLVPEKKGRVSGKSLFGAVSLETRLQLLCEKYDKTQDKECKKKLEYYQVPLESNERKPLTCYAQKFLTNFEKLAMNPKTGEQLPLVASVSRSTVRLLVSLLDLNAFNTPAGQFDFDKAQIFTDCLKGFIIHGGHHSKIETEEVYNRLIDYVVIEKMRPSPDFGSTPQEAAERFPYFKVGYDRNTLFHRSYVEDVVNSVPSLVLR